MIGWTLLSREQVAKAEEALKADSQTVLDEVGLLALHQGFADRFFPGTSVLHTRLRYALFVPWAMEESRGDPRELSEIEVRIARKLARTWDPSFRRPLGIIGVETLPQAPSQPPSTSYWGAIGTWGLLRRDSPARSRSGVLKALGVRVERNRRQHAVDGELLTTPETSPFVELPPPPEGWSKVKEPLSFELTADERKLLRRHWLGLRQTSGSGARSVLSSLADISASKQRNVTNLATHAWSLEVTQCVGESEAKTIELARQAAALSCVARAVYAAMVERQRVQDGIAGGSTMHSKRLEAVIQEFGAAARLLDIESIKSTLPGLPEDLLELMRQTRDWVFERKIDPEKLRDAYEKSEWNRKRERARLLRRPSGRQRRAEWDPELHPLAEPLHYRWPTVRRLLSDLAGS